MSRRSIEPCGVSAEALAALEDHDSTFYGPDEQSSSDSDGERPYTPPPKQMYLGDDDDECFSSDDETAAAFAQPAPTQDEAIAAASESVEKWKQNGCGCQENHFLLLDSADLVTHVVAISNMKKPDKKLLMIGELSASLQLTAGQQRKFAFAYSCRGHKVCRQVFQSVHAIGNFTLRSLQEQVESGNVTPPAHKSVGRVAPNVLPPDIADGIGQFVKSYAAVNGMPQPAAPRGRSGVPASLFTSFNQQTQTVCGV